MKIALVFICFFSIIYAKSKHAFYKRKSKCKEGDPPGPKDADITGDYGGLLPTFYHLELQLPVEDKASSTGYVMLGSMELQFRVNRTAKYIYLMTEDTAIDTTKITLKLHDPLTETSKSVKIIYRCLDLKKYSLILRPDKSLPAQHNGDSSYYILSIPQFESKIRKPFEDGVFVESEGGSTIATQFQTDLARTAFPCIDIPQFKTNFEVKIIHPEGTTSLANMESIASGKQSDGWLWNQFLSTPPLPTYLVAFAIKPASKLKHVTTTTCQNINLTVYSKSENMTKLNELLNDAVFALESLMNDFHIPLQLRKIDFIEVDGYMGAMENFGLVTLMPHFNAELDKVHIQAHELAHHWVGNMATVRNWRPLAIQEGMTDYLANRVVVKYLYVHGREHEGDNYWVRKQKTSVGFPPSDSLYLDYAPDFMQAGAKLYGKAVGLAGNIESMVGEEQFMIRMREFLGQYAYRDFTMTDFKSFFDDIIYKVDDVTMSVADVYEQWFITGGLPVLGIERNLTENTLQLYQMDDEQTQWAIPLKFELPGSNKTDFYPSLMIGSAKFSLSGVADQKTPVISNPGGVFSYRVVDDIHNSELLLAMIAEGTDKISFRAKVWLLENFCHFKATVKGADELWEKYGKKIEQKEPDIDHFDVYDKCNKQMSETPMAKKKWIRM